MIKKFKAFMINIYYFLFHYSVWEEREQKRSFGELNPDKTFYVIRFDKTRFGLLTIWKFVLGHIEYARKKGYIPIIDLKNYYSRMIQDVDSAGKENAWEYYFEQPNKKYTLEEVYQSKNVILAVKNIRLSEGVRLVTLPMEEEKFRFWSDVSACIPVKEEVEQAAQEIGKKIFPKGEKILGASIRYEYSYLQEVKRKTVNGHPIQPEVEEFVQDIKMYMSEWGCKYCFLAIDDDSVLKMLQEKLGNKCIYLERWRRSYWKEKRLGVDNEPNYLYGGFLRNTVTKRGVDYLTELLLLAQCDCLLAGKSSGNIFAYLKNGRHYEHVSIYEKGEIRIE